jgi:hypothetical protein
MQNTNDITTQVKIPTGTRPAFDAKDRECVSPTLIAFNKKEFTTAS